MLAGQYQVDRRRLRRRQAHEPEAHARDGCIGARRKLAQAEYVTEDAFGLSFHFMS